MRTFGSCLWMRAFSYVPLRQTVPSPVRSQTIRDNTTEVYLQAAPLRLQRMLLRLQNYDVHYPVSSRKNSNSCRWSRLPKQETDPAIRLDIRVNLVHFSAHRTEQLRQETARDPELGPLCDMIIEGWPMEQRNMPTVLIKPYWAYRDELSLEDGIILKGSEQVL